MRYNLKPIKTIMTNFLKELKEGFAVLVILASIGLLSYGAYVLVSPLFAINIWLGGIASAVAYITVMAIVKVMVIDSLC